MVRQSRTADGGRTLDSAEDSIDLILRLVPEAKGRLKALVLDASDLDSVKTVAEQLCETERLYILVKNTDLGLGNLETNKQAYRRKC
jgi:hypothetical protein